MSVIPTTEFAATSEESIQAIANELSTTERKVKVFKAIYSGGNKPKTASDISLSTGLTEIAVLQLATPMANKQYCEQVKVNGRVAFKKLRHFNAVKDRILRLAKNPANLKKFVSARTPHQTVKTVISRTKRNDVRIREIFIDDIKEFSRVRALPPQKLAALHPKRLPERVFKYGIARILATKGKFQDWGGEKNDLYTNHITLYGKRRSAAFALKGPATRPPLTIAKLGKHGDQITRLFSTHSQVFLIQFEGQIVDEVLQDMMAHAIRRSHETGREVFYGVIALEDSHRLRTKYKSEFDKAKND